MARTSGLKVLRDQVEQKERAVLSIAWDWYEGRCNGVQVSGSRIEELLAARLGELGEWRALLARAEGGSDA